MVKLLLLDKGPKNSQTVLNRDDLKEGNGVITGNKLPIIEYHD
jgi:hypothetical protein